jgi:outer membrane protein assembly factor BamB
VPIAASSAVHSRLLPAVLAFTFAGCGGSGSGGSQVAAPGDPRPPLIVNPSALSAQSVEGQSSAVTTLVSYDGQVDTSFPPTLKLEYDDNIISSVDVRPAGLRTAFVTLSSSAELEVGEHGDTVELYVCTSPSCSRLYSSTAVTLAYHISVTPAPAARTLKPLPTVTGLPEWETYQGNPAHTGHVPVTLDMARFTTGWSWTSPFLYTLLSPATTGSGLVVVSATGSDSPAYLVALNEADGTTAWQHDFGSVHNLNHPAAAAGRVFVATSGREDTAMWSFELATGQQLFRAPFESQWDSYLAPTFGNGIVYTNGGYYGGLYAFEATSGLTHWFASLAPYHSWSPAVDDTYAHAYTGSEWVAVNRVTGEPLFSVPNGTFNGDYALNTAPVIDTPDTIVVVDAVQPSVPQLANHLIRYSISQRNELWHVSGSFASNPATADGRIYVLSTAANGLDVYDASNGAKLWSWGAPEEIPVGNLIVTNNLVFASTATATYAIDVVSHQSVWSTPQAGHLALSSNGVLYIVSSQRIDAYELM